MLLALSYICVNIKNNSKKNISVKLNLCMFYVQYTIQCSRQALEHITCQYSPGSKFNDLGDWSMGCGIHTSSLSDEAVMTNRHGF